MLVTSSEHAKVIDEGCATGEFPVTVSKLLAQIRYLWYTCSRDLGRAWCIRHVYGEKSWGNEKKKVPLGDAKK